MTDLARFHQTNPSPPLTSDFFDRFYLASTLISLTSLTASKFIHNSNALPFFSAFVVVGMAGASAFWKRRDIETINTLQNSLNNLSNQPPTSATSTNPSHSPDSAQASRLMEENQVLKKQADERAKEIEELRKKLQFSEQQKSLFIPPSDSKSTISSPTSASSNYVFKSKRPEPTKKQQ